MEDTDFLKNPIKKLYKTKNEKKFEEDDIPEDEVEPVFMYQHVLENPKIDKKYSFYPFLRKGGGACFSFPKHSKGICKFCPLLDGYFSLSTQKLKVVSDSKVNDGFIEPHKFTNHIEFAMCQLFFEIFIF